MSYFLYFASLVTIIVLAILFQEYRKLGGTKAVLSRLTAKNRWNTVNTS